MSSIKPYKESVCKHCNDGVIRKTIGGLCFENPYHYQKNQQTRYAEKQKLKVTKPKRIKPISDKKAAELREYRKVRDEYFKDNPICEYPECQSRDVTLHHKRGRIGSDLTNKRFFASLCLKHHSEIEQNPDRAKELGLSLSRLNNYQI